MTTRIENLGEGVDLESMCPALTMEWDPVTNSGTIVFQVAKYVVVRGEIREDIAPSPDASLIVPLTEIMTRTYAEGLTDPVTGADLSGVTPMGIMQYAKAAFDTIHNERYGSAPPEEPDLPEDMESL